MNSDSKPSGYYPYPGSPGSSTSAQYSNISSWGTLPTPVPGTPYLAPAHPALQQPYNAILPPHPAPYSSESATHPPVAALTLRLTPHPRTRIPSMDVTLSSDHPGPLTVYDVQIFVSRTLSRPITHSELRVLTEQVAYNAASAAFHARTANNPTAFANGMCIGDRMGGAWCIIGVVPTAEPGVWEVRLDVPRSR
ncbi:hypothetical protein C0992_010295 [Termitomyces sp. T32_za158]|nr:hypothetical protein C0992_010295 [Termitomyces sp. T32_za158]